MINITIPNNFLPERGYIVDVILGEFLELKYEIHASNEKDSRIILENGKGIIIKDSFFSKFDNGLPYLEEKNIPSKVNFFKNQFTSEGDIPVIYGDKDLKISDKEIACGIDIFASSFFMLSRWEEYANKIRDIHNRFPVTASLAYKNNFLDRPVVNEYLEMLWNMLKFLGYKGGREKRNFKMMLTHDVDFPLCWTGGRGILRELGGDLLRRKSISLAFSSFKSFLQSRLDLKKDPYNTFGYLMDISERMNLKSHFFLEATEKSRYDTPCFYKNKFMKDLMKEITDRGHVIGFHPGYYTYNNRKLWMKEFECLSQYSPQSVVCGRQHFLKFEVPKTWQIWEDNNMEWDSTLTYAAKEGFRCGTCYEFSVFNILSRKKLRLKEMPLIVMEGSLMDYQKASPEYMQDTIFFLIKKVKKYKGNFVFLWHNSRFNTPQWGKYRKVYENSLFII